jgi:hypothetical protein
MRSILLTLLAAMSLLLGAPASAQGARGVYAITDVTVVPMDRERLLPGRTVIVRDGRIETIGPARSARIPAGAIRIEGRGRYLMPGLAEMHAHVPGGADPQWAQDVLFLYAANGITFARGMLGAPAHLELRSRLGRGRAHRTPASTRPAPPSTAIRWPVPRTGGGWSPSRRRPATIS